MRKICFLIALLTFYSITVFAQNIIFEEIVKNETIQLNGGIRASLGGKSRTYLPIKIPHNCTGIIYTITAFNSSKPIESNIGLATGLATMLSTGNIALASAASKIEVPAGTESADVYLMLEFKDVNNFLAKNGLERWLIDFSRTARSSAQVFIPIDFKDWNKTVYLAFKNPSAYNPVSITVNVVAALNN